MLEIGTAMDGSWQAFKVAEVGNSRWVIWGVQPCYFMLSTLKKERHMVTGLKTTEDLVHSLNIYISWSVMEIFFPSKNISQKHQANMSFLWKLLNLFLSDPQGLFWATLGFPESQGLLTCLSVQ